MLSDFFFPEAPRVLWHWMTLGTLITPWCFCTRLWIPRKYVTLLNWETWVTWLGEKGFRTEIMQKDLDKLCLQLGDHFSFPASLSLDNRTFDSEYQLYLLYTCMYIPYKIDVITKILKKCQCKGNNSFLRTACSLR